MSGEILRQYNELLRAICKLSLPVDMKDQVNNELRLIKSMLGYASYALAEKMMNEMKSKYGIKEL